jgi:uncharacterized protein YraI
MFRLDWKFSDGCFEGVKWIDSAMAHVRWWALALHVWIKINFL